MPTRGRFHKPIYALRRAFTLCAQLLRSYLQAQKFGAERKSLAQSVNGFMKLTHGLRKNENKHLRKCLAQSVNGFMKLTHGLRKNEKQVSAKMYFLPLEILTCDLFEMIYEKPDNIENIKQIVHR